MFVKLHRILLSVVLVVAIFFVVSSLSFSNRLAEGTSSVQRLRPALLISRIQTSLLTHGKSDGGY